MKPSATKKTSKKASLPLPSTAAAPLPITVGLDLGDRHSHFCVLDVGGVPHEQGKVVMSPKDLTAFFARVAPARLVMEVGGQSPWVSRLAQTAGLEVIVANPRRVQLITRNERKNDRTDAELLARLGRADPHLLSPVQHRSAQCQADLAVGRARDIAVASRTGLINHVRGAIKSYGQRLPTCSPDSFHKRVVSHLPVELAPALTPIVQLIGLLTEQILGPFGPDCDLRRFGQKLAAQGGKNGRKRAKVAVARKLAVLLHHLWKTGEVYDPLHLAKKRGEAVPA
jgi:hypothetical protein